MDWLDVIPAAIGATAALGGVVIASVLTRSSRRAEQRENQLVGAYQGVLGAYYGVKREAEALALLDPASPRRREQEAAMFRAADSWNAGRAALEVLADDKSVAAALALEQEIVGLVDLARDGTERQYWEEQVNLGASEAKDRMVNAFRREIGRPSVSGGLPTGP